MIIVSRLEPPLPLARWRIQHWLTELHATDLRFLDGEAQTFFTNNMRGNLSSDVINQIVVRTEGWITGLQMAQLSLAEVENPEVLARNFIGRSGRIVDYLVGEVVTRQTEEIKYFLSMTAILERFCAPLCDHLMANDSIIPESGRLIDCLKKENLFLISLDGNSFWYRYHHLFQEMLIQQMRKQFSQNQQVLIHRRAGEWFARQGYIEDALRHLIIAEDFDTATELVESQMHAVIDRDPSRRELTRWLKLFPRGVENKRPALLVAKSFQKLFSWDLAGMISLLDKAESLLKEPNCTTPEDRTQSLLGDIAAQRAICQTFKPDVQKGLHYARQGLQLVPKDHNYLHTSALVYTAACMFFCGEKDDALLMLNKALTEDCAAGSINSGHILVTKAAIFSYGANWDAVEASVKSILTLHKTINQADYWLGYAYYFLGIAAYECNQLESASEYFSEVEKMRYRVTTRVYHEALLGKALVGIAKADAEQVKKYSAAAYSFAIETKDPFSKQMSDLFKVKHSISIGKILSDPVPYKFTDDSTRYWLLYVSVTQAEYLVHKGDECALNEALDCIENGLEMARKHHNLRLEIQFLTIKALALKYTGGHNAALELLEKTLNMAEPFGLVRSFLDRGPLMAELLSLLSATRPGNLYAKSLLDSFENQTPSADSAAPAAHFSILSAQIATTSDSSVLTNRELDVLRLLHDRLTDKEIAEKLFISVTTVKSHTKSIYRKLKVPNRRLAVWKAMQLGLLPKD
ncbi:LuxR C-terminal-related transcriptional regulator [Desulfopila sp. IMCC35008]|uniref:LuxR C-terminal-related transcriptional regulator n=1 Tax=Desulfopila sp. IMCC35008 TaxID=2653858 RepID=UPI002715341A|nr:LuxR C-terminal-related transcriptional regulator [Desulfopila sp. IMCC35008]